MPVNLTEKDLTAPTLPLMLNNEDKKPVPPCPAVPPRDFCSPCHARYCGNCIHASGKVIR